MVAPMTDRLDAALEKRALMLCSKTSVQRLIHDEGDGFPGLTADRLDRAVLVEAHREAADTETLVRALEASGVAYLTGTSWTVDAFYRETVAEAKHYQAEGVLTVDMEASALFSVAQYRGVEIGAIFAISDSLAELVWQPEFHLETTSKGLETLYRVALAALLAD